MNLRVYNNKPMSWFDDFSHSLENFWDTPFNLNTREKKFTPACDVHENKDYYFFSFDMPGVKKEDIHVEFRDNTLYISGEKRNTYNKAQKDGSQLYEKSYGKFQRAFTLPSTIEETTIETHFKNGVLELLVPKKKAHKEQVIPIKDENKTGLFSRLLKSND